MARGITDSFHDGIARLLGDLGKMRAYPDANDELLDTIQNMLVQTVRQTLSGPGQPAMGGASLGGGGAQMVPGQGMSNVQDPLAALLGAGQGGAMPVTEAGLSRGPVPGMDTSGAASAIERELAGQV